MADTTVKPAAEEEGIDFAAELKKDLEAEEHDNGKYTKLAAEADRQYPCRGYGAILRDIAKEEAVHHKHLRMILEDMHAMPEE